MKPVQRNHYPVVRQSGPIYFMGVVGAMVYFLQHTGSFWMGVLGVLKAFVWPAVLVYKLLEFIKA